MGEFVRAVLMDLDYFLLMFTRTSALIFTSPIFGRRNIPNIAKISFCLAVTLALYSGFPKTEPLVYQNMIAYAMMVVMELLVGLVIGYVTNMFITLTFTAGQIIDMQMGFGMVNVFDVQSSGNIPVTGNLLNIVIMIVFFAVNGHLRLLGVLRSLMLNIPLGGVTVLPGLGFAAAEAFITAFVLAVNVSMPLIAAGVLSEVGLGLIVRTVPQMNVFVVGIPVKIAMGLLVLAFIMPVYVNYCSVIFDQLFASVESIFGSMIP